MKYKLVAVDIDGTLLNNQGIITDKTINSIKRVVDMGVKFIISSGRPTQGVEKINQLLNLDMPLITYNGAMIVANKAKDILFEQKLTSEEAIEVLKWGKKFSTTVIVWSNNKLYVNRINDNVRHYQMISNIPPILIENEKDVIDQGITKIIFYDTNEKLRLYQDILKNNLQVNISFYISLPILLEFINIKASKGIALKFLGEYYGIKREEMVAIGDGFNDLPMIEYAGLGVAMGNAPLEVKQKADYITLSNDNDGLAYVLEQFIK